jgi:hypothetical protein
MILVGLLNGCVSRSVIQDNIVQIAPDVFLEMPLPTELGYPLTASQLVLVEYGEENHQLPVQLQVNSQKLVLAGFSSWGTRIMSLTYENGAISTSVAPGLGQTLPDPEQILFNVMITLWPLEAWTKPLDSIGWTLKESPKQRQLINGQQQVIATIRYETEPYLDGDVVFINHPLNLKVTIKTLNYSR